MNLISDILFWISKWTFSPCCCIAYYSFHPFAIIDRQFFRQYLAIRRTDALLRQQLDTLTIRNFARIGRQTSCEVELVGHCVYPSGVGVKRPSGTCAAPVG